MKGLRMKNIMLIGVLVSLIACTGWSVDGQSQVPGQALFQQWCAACHASGPSYPATRLLNQRYCGAIPGALEARTDLSPDSIARIVRNGAPGMPPRGENQLGNSELNAIIRYLTPENEMLPSAKPGRRHFPRKLDPPKEVTHDVLPHT